MSINTNNNNSIKPVLTTTPTVQPTLPSNVNTEAASEDKDFELFADFITQQLFSPDNSKDLSYEQKHFPIIVWISEELITYITYRVFNNSKEAISEFLGSDTVAGTLDIELEFYLAFLEFSQTKKSERLVKFLETGKKALIKYNLNSGKGFEFYNSLISLFKTANISLLGKSIEYFIEFEDETLLISTEDEIAIAMCSLAQVASNIMRLHKVDSHSFALHQKRLNRSNDDITPPTPDCPIQMHCAIAETRKLDSKNLNNNSEFPLLSKEDVYTIRNAFRKTYFKYCSQSASFRQVCQNDLEKDLLTRYADVVYFKNAGIKNTNLFLRMKRGPKGPNNEIFLSFPQKYDFKDPSNYVTYYLENINIYKNFLAHAKEVCSLLIPSAEELKEVCTVLKDFNLYLRFGDLQKLKQKLNQKSNNSPEQLERIVMEEVLAFSKALNTDRTLLMKTLPLLKQAEMKEINQFRNFFSVHESYYTTFLKLRQVLLKPDIAFAEPYDAKIPSYLQKIEQETKKVENTLPNSENKTRKKNKKKETKPTEEAPKPEPIDVNNNNATSEVLPKEVASPNAPVNTQAVVLTPFQSLQQSRDKIKESFEALSNNCNSFGTKEAILNAQSHYDELLCIMRRFLEQSKQPISRQVIATFILHCVQHGFLGAEQVLSALEREGNQIDNQEALNLILNHDLIRILVNCRLEAGIIPQHLREWVRYARLGEYWLRDLNACELGNPSVQKLLAKLKLFVEGNGAFSAEELVKGAIEFAEKSALLCENLQLQIDALKTQPSAQQKQLAQDFKKSFRSACQSVLNNCNKITLDSRNVLPAMPYLNPVKELIERIRRNALPYTIEYSLTDIAKNHIPHLETEIQFQSYLNPFETRLHLRWILRNNQQIVEKVLRALLNEYQPERNFGIEEHDLSILASALGMNEADFSQEEWQWLNAGRTIHYITRYWASYDASSMSRKTDYMKKVEKALYGAQEIAQKQAMDYHYNLDQGFTIADKEISSKLDAAKELARDDLALMHSILEKIFAKILR